MKITLDNKRTSIDFAELVEGEAFMTMDDAKSYIYCTSYRSHEGELYHMVMRVTENGLVPFAWRDFDFPVIPLDIQSISFSTSTLRNGCKFCDSAD